ncbi:DUF6879 family protein [Streptomyces sp. W1SF4]|uniref:DUF6879 family protein n=1 Tax=Streptomyces sp. W1SF4 TaxID=2305220 RepID=UPI0026AD6923
MQPPAGQALARARHSAVHLELRDRYTLDDPGFMAWQRGERLDPANLTSWWVHDVVREATGREVVVLRLRIASERVSAYVRYEYDCTCTNIAAGESFRYSAHRPHRAHDVPTGVFRRRRGGACPVTGA